MNQLEAKTFSKNLEQLFEGYGQQCNEFLMKIWLHACQDYSLDEVIHAILTWTACPERGKWAPKPADIVELMRSELQRQQGQPVQSPRLSPSEAWAIAVTSIDEKKTIVWTDEIAQAFNITRPILDFGDKVGARMAFIDAYKRIVERNQTANVQPTVITSLGWDASSRNEVSNSPAAQMLLKSTCPQQHKALEGDKVQKNIAQNVRDHIAKLRKKWKEQDAKMLNEKNKEREEERADWEHKKQLQYKKVDAYLRQQQPIAANEAPQDATAA